MPNSPWIECTSHTYSKLKALGIVSVVFYVIGFPVIVIYLVIRFFPKRSTMSLEDRKKLDAWLGPIYLPYKPQYQSFFEIFMLFRRVILATALSMISSSSTLQTFVVWLVLITSAIIHLRLQPFHRVSCYRDHSSKNKRLVSTMEVLFSENVLEPIVLTVLSMSFMVLRFAALDSPRAGIFVWVVIIINTCVFVALLGGILYRLVYKDGNRGDSNGNPDCANGEGNNSNAAEYGDGTDDERMHLLPLDGQRGYMPINDVA